MSSIFPRLWVVATPIGNRGDVSQRSRDVLGTVEVILAEDTRQAGRLCQELGLEGKRFLSLFEHNEQARIEQVLGLLEQGHSLALISGAGSPVISDPGYQLVRACRQAGYRVSPVPGPSAPIAALMVCGLPPIPFTFLGFLPRKDGEKRKLLAGFRGLASTLVFFERKSRLDETLKLAHDELGPREVCLARELTKRHEELIHFHLGQWERLPETPRGEFTVVIAPADKVHRAATPESDVRRLLEEGFQRGGSPRSTVREVQSLTEGWTGKELYELSLRIKESGDRSGRGSGPGGSDET